MDVGKSLLFVLSVAVAGASCAPRQVVVVEALPSPPRALATDPPPAEEPPSDLLEPPPEEPSSDVDEVGTPAIEVPPSDVDEVGTPAIEEPSSDAEEVGTPAIEHAGGPAPEGVTRYPTEGVHSPLTAAVAERLGAIRAAGPDLREDVFLKAGASETADRRYLRCFWANERSTWDIDLGDHERLRGTLEHFQRGRGGGSTPFLRDSLAVKVGHSTGWPISGDPSPLAREMRATRAAWAIVSFGTNDLSASAPDAALQTYMLRLGRLLDRLIDAGVVPVLFGTGPRADSPIAARWSPIYAILTRAAAEARQIPFVDVLEATRGLPAQGLVRDGIHGNAWVDERRGIQPCVFRPEALQFHYNVRNLITLEALDRARRGAQGDPSVLEPPPLRPVEGEGISESPFIIDRVPFFHRGTTRGGDDLVDSYDRCAPDLDMSGPERTYRLVVDEPSPVRIVALSADGVDVDVHLVEGADADGLCHARDTRLVAGTLEAGVWTIAVDTFADARGRSHPGQYTLIVMPCDEDDPECAARYGAESADRD